MRLIRLKEPLDIYHQSRADRHGWVYFAHERPSGLIEAKSVATGVLCTLDKYMVEFLDDGPQLP